MKRTTGIVIFITIGLITGGAVQYIQRNHNNDQLLPHLLENTVNHSTELARLVPTVLKTPEPLRIRKDDSSMQMNRTSELSQNGVFTLTNKQRQANNVSTLTRNTVLDQVAQNKLQDMFDNQYFEHESPTGVGPGDIVKAIGYDYLTAGENLALGDFSSDEDLVQAWMDSPGHRENIVSSQFTEIGIAVQKGLFEGRDTWLAVQTFAKPASACTSPDHELFKHIDALQTEIENNNHYLADIDGQIEQKRFTLEKLVTETENLAKKGNKLVADGNAEIKQGNSIYEETGDQSQAQPYWDRGEDLQNQGQDLLNQAKAQQTQLQSLQDELQNTINDYNNSADSSQSTADQLKDLVETYNKQVNTYNTCANS